MAKKSRTKAREGAAAAAVTPEGAVGPRQPCPCGSGKRYKACHGAPGGAAPTFVRRPFEGMPSECDVIAMRELVPAGSAPLALREGSREVRLCTLLPAAAPAMVRESGAVWLGLQVQHHFGDVARDLGAVLEKALAAAEAGETGVVGLTDPPAPGGPRLQDLVADEPLTVTVHDGFDFWIDDVEDEDTRTTMAGALDQANAVAYPTARLTQVEAAYWTNVGSKEHLRWVMPEPEDELLSALARLHVAGKDVLVEGARFVGMFRAHGLLAPVWDLPVGTGPEPLEGPAAQFAQDLAAALADGSDLTSEERSARNGLANRQVTLR